VPMGMTLREIIYDIAGGPQEGHRIKAVQTGGPTGGCVPEAHFDTPVDYDSLNKIGSLIGSGGMIVMDESACMVELAKYFMSFCMAESCGQCVPCRVGTAHMHSLLEKITEGSATLDDLTMLEDMSTVIKQTSLCGLGQAAPNPVLSTLRHFRDEYLEHIVDHTCRAHVCSIREAVL
jgi:bidirectional [NiFe] hydrogenase diaphorase subunit